MNGTATACERNESVVTADAAFKWTSKLDNNQTQVDVLLGWHRQTRRINGNTPTLPNSPDRRTLDEPVVAIRTMQSAARGGILNSHTVLADGAPNPLAIAVSHNYDQNESDKVMTACRDETKGFVSVDAFPLIPNCPWLLGAPYRLGGPGNTDDTLEKRISGKLTLTQRVHAVGHHQLKAGADVEINEVSTRPRRTTSTAAPRCTRSSVATSLDLAYAHAIDDVQVRKNLNWKNTTARANPLTGRVGVTIFF